MKNKIKQFSKGNFQVSKPEIVFPDTNLIIMIGEGEVYKGSFTIENHSDGVIRGLVYSSSFRMRCIEQGFEGNPVKIRFEYDGIGLPPGHVERGTFSVVCNGGEYSIAFTAIIEKPYVMTSYGKVQSTDDFKKLAIKDYSEAQRLFRSREFYEVLKYENPRIFHLYDNMRKWSLDEQAMEEFLVGIKQKECIFLTLSSEGMLFEDLKEATKGTLKLLKNTWGFMPVEIKMEGGFITTGRTHLTTDDFVGNVCEIEFLVHPEHLHAGRNFGRLLFVTPYEVLTYEIEVCQNSTYNEEKREIGFLMAQIIKEYISYTAGRISLERWHASAVEKTKKMRSYDSVNDMLQLFQAHIYIIGNGIEEAKWILENYNYNRFAIGRDPKSNAYYLYLTALIRKSGSHVERVIDEVGKTYMHHQDSMELLLMVLGIDPQYKDPTRRLKVLEQQFYQFECNHVLLYLEAFLCIKEKPNLLKKLGKFEYHILNFASKYRLMTKELALYVSNLASQQKSYHAGLFRVLERIYAMYQEPMILNAICTFLIKGEQMNKENFVWYQRAVDAELKIAQLYEYYMATIDETKVREALPRSIFLYFMHGNNLEYKKAALLYANLITYEQYASDLYITYREQMVYFAWDQLMKRHISDSLKIIYRKFCTEEEMTGERLEAMYDLCYAYKVTTKIHNMKCILVIEKDGSVKQRVPVREDGTIVYLYDKEARIIWESKDGHFFTDSILYETTRLLYEPRFMEMCKKYMTHITNWSNERNKEELTFELLCKKGMEEYEEKEVFQLCSKKIREDNYEEDDALIHFCYRLFEKQQYDKVILTYLSNYYCGETRNMKKLWKVAKEYGIPVSKLGERIISQMIFSESVFGDEEIFLDYYINGNPYFRLKQAYLAYVSREYIVYDRIKDDSFFEIIINEEKMKEELADICKVAVLKYYSFHEFDAETGSILRQMMRELCEKQLIFPFFLKYDEIWLRETQLYDKVMVEYRAIEGGKVTFFHKLKSDGKEDLDYKEEGLTPMYENIYVKSLVLYKGETLRYYFKEEEKDLTLLQEERLLEQKREIPAIGRFGKLNKMAEMNWEDRKKAMQEYQHEMLMAEKIFHEF